MANLKEMYSEGNLEVAETKKTPIDELLAEDYSGKDFRTSFRTNEKLWKRFTSVCKKNLLTNASVLNQMMMEYIAKNENKQD